MTLILSVGLANYGLTGIPGEILHVSKVFSGLCGNFNILLITSP